ncbi:MAG: NAD-dependent epimerase/dehydratase family protein [Gammaproteobacteria bacterium]|nr:NAD-dependent epimerase/dehydratase family protein [Gammaproteobacteria bacterium]
MRYFFTSLTRITDLQTGPFDVEPLPRSQWDTGDYVAAEVIGTPSSLYRAELDSGRLVDVVPGDNLIGAFGTRAATLEGVGDWKHIESDLQMEALTAAGLFGKATSTSPLLPRLMSLIYKGHVIRNGQKLCMKNFVGAVKEQNFDTPIVLLVGTSMSAGKTTTGRLIIHELKKAGLSVVGAKLTGAGRYRDILSFADAGADHIFDFVDVGLPSTVCSEEEYRTALLQLLSRIARLNADVMVTECGASPLEPYNGQVAINEIRSNVRCTVLCASDPYAVAGVQVAFAIDPDLVAGPAANTDAAISLVKKLTGVTAMNLMKTDALPGLNTFLKEKLDF